MGLAHLGMTAHSFCPKLSRPSIISSNRNGLLNGFAYFDRLDARHRSTLQMSQAPYWSSLNRDGR